MAQNSKIEWTHHTLNLWHGCTKVHEGCDNCYAEALAKRWGNDIWGNDKPRKEISSAFRELDKMQQAAKQDGEMHRVFVGSMMDIFEKPLQLIDSKGMDYDFDGLNTGILRSRLFSKIMLKQYENLMFLFLTKRPSNINKYIPEHWKNNPPANVMFGTSPVNQQTFETLVRHLQEVNGKRFLSIEPQLDKIVLGDLKGIDWIIQGGESGHNKREFEIDWAYDLLIQCKTAKIPYFFKQIDKIQAIPIDLQIREFPKFDVGSALYVSNPHN